MSRRIGPVIATVGADTKGFTDGLSKAQKSLQQFSSTAAIAGVRASAAFAATFGVIAAFSIKVGAEFELAMANVKKTVEATPAVFEALEQTILDTSRSFGVAATEIADLARIGGQLGIAAEDLDEFAETMVKLSIAAVELDPEVAARGLARLAALTGEGAGQIEKMANVLAKLGDTLPTTEARILDFAARTASFTSAVGLSSEEILGLAAGFSALVGGTERAATAVERFLAQLSKAVADGGDKMKAFADVAMKAIDSPIESAEQFGELFADKPLEAIELVLGGMETLGKEGLAPLLVEFDKLGISGVRMLSTFAAGAKGADKLRQALATAKQEAKDQTKLQRELAVQLDTVARQFDILKAFVVEVGIQLFKAFRDEIMFVIQALIVGAGALISFAKVIGSLPSFIQFAILGFVGLLGAAAGLLVVIGTLGGLIAGLGSLLTKASALFLTTGASATTAGTQMSLFGASTTTASVGTGLLTRSLALAKVALVQFALPIVGILAAGAVLSAIFSSMSINASNLSPKMAEAAGNLGFFGRMAETAKIGMEAFGGVITGIQDVFASQDEVVKATTQTVGEADEATKGWGSSILELGGKISQFIPPVFILTTAVKGLFAAQGKLDEISRMNTETAAKLGAASFIEGRQITNLAEANAILAPRIAAVNERLKQQKVETDKLRQSGELLVTSMAQTVEQMLASKEESARLGEVSKFLGITVKDLQAKIEETEGAFLKFAEVKMKDAAAADAAAKANKELAEAVKSLSVEGAIEEFDKLAEQIKFAEENGKTFTDEAVAQMGEELERLADITGSTLTPKMVQLITAWKADAAAAKEAAAATKEAEEAEKAAAKAAEELTNALKGLTVEGATEEFDALQEKIEEANKRGLTFTDEGLKQMAEESKRLAEVTGQELSPEMEEIVKRFEEMTESSAEIKQIESELKIAKERTKEWNQALTAVNDVMSILGISSDSAFGQILGGITTAAQAASKFGESLLEAKLQIAKIGEEGGGFGDFLKEGGLEAGIELGSALVQGVQGVIAAGGEGGLSGAIGGAIAGAQLGSEIGGAIGGPAGKAIGAAIGAGVGAAISLFRGKPEFKKIMEDVGKEWGVDISEALAKEIEATAERLDIGRMEATLLSLGDVMAEAGGVIEFGMENAAVAVNDLMNAIATGAVPAAEGIEELGSVFAQMTEELFEAGTIADGVMLQMIERTRQLGIEVPEITAFIAEQLAQAAEGVTALIGQALETEGGDVVFGGIQVASAEDAQAQATIFSAAFFATLSEQGLVAAVDAFGPAFDEMKAKFAEFGDEVDFGGVSRLFKIADDPTFRPLIEGIQGLKDSMTGLANAGFLTADTFAAFQQQGVSAFEQLTAAGLKTPEALQQIAPFLQEAITASQQFGFEIDADTQALIEQAEASGIAFKTDPMVQMVDILKLVAEQLGVLPEALDQIGNTSITTGEQLTTSLGPETTEPILENWQETGEQMNEIYQGIGENAVVTGEQLTTSLGSDTTTPIIEDWNLAKVSLDEVYLGMQESGLATGEVLNTSLGMETTEQVVTAWQEAKGQIEGVYQEIANTGEQAAEEITQSFEQGADETIAATDSATEATEGAWAETIESVKAQFDEFAGRVTEDYTTVVENTGIAGEAVINLGSQAISAAAGFDRMAAAARSAADAARAASNAGGGGGGGGGPQGGQFGLTTTVNEPTTFVAGEAGSETVEITPGGGRGGAPVGSNGPVILQVDGKTLGRILGDLSRTGDVRIHPSAVREFG